jgi:hypothetical protein
MRNKPEINVSIDTVKQISASGHAYPIAVRAVATLLILGTAIIAVRAWDVASGELVHQIKWVHWLLAASVIGVMLWYYVCLMRSRITVRDGEVHQTWMWDKRASVDAMLKARFVGVPYAPWLMVARLSVRTRDGRWIMFYSGSREVSEAFAQIDVAVSQDLRRQMGL